MTLNPNAIPARLRSLPQWICWRFEIRDGKQTKVPINPMTGGYASTTDSQTWAAFPKALAVAARYEGIGFVFAADDPYCGVDLDGCRDPDTGVIHDWARVCIERFDTYAEVSPSGSGVKLFGRGALPADAWHKVNLKGAPSYGGKAPAIEVYDRARFFAVTGVAVEGAAMDVVTVQEALDALEASYARPKPASNGVRPTAPLEIDDTVLLELARNAKDGFLFRALYDQGDTSRYRHEDGTADQSSADMALCNLLAFWSGGDEGRMDRLFRSSALMREKWERADYRAMTIGKAMAGRTDFYQGPTETVEIGSGARTGRNGARPEAETEAEPDDHQEHAADEEFQASETSEPKQPPLLKTARLWARAVHDQWLFLDGGQWWRYEDECWRYAGNDFAEQAVMRFMERLKGGNRAPVTPARIHNVLALAKGILGPVKQDDMHPHKDCVPLKNGLYNTTTGALKKHDPRHLATYCLPYEYDAKARCPVWDKFIQQVLIRLDGSTCEEWVEFAEEWLGVCCTMLHQVQATLVNVGEGGNGKGTFARVLERLVGRGNHWPIDIEQLQDPYHRASIYGKLVGFINEPGVRALKKNGGMLKAISGGDEISGRNPTERPFQFRPTCRLVVSCNALPETRDLSFGYFRRLIILEWRYTPEMPDETLEDRLGEELPGIFNRAMDGLSRFCKRGHRFATLPESDALKDEYRMSQDPMETFLDECYALDRDGWCATSIVYERYRRWCSASGISRDRELSKIDFGRRLTTLLRRKGILGLTELSTVTKRLKTDKNKVIRVYRGVAAAPDPAAEMEVSDAELEEGFDL